MALQLEPGPLTKDTVLARIPAFPAVVLRVLRLLGTEAVAPASLAREITGDPMLSAQVVRLANSPLFGGTDPLDTVDQAAEVLGCARIEALIIAVAITNYMKQAAPTEALQKCWRHTVATAVLSEELARGAGMAADRAYSFGLFHDIGRLGLLAAYPEEYEALLQAADEDAVPLADVEQSLFGLDHAEAGRKLAGKWGLPPEFAILAGGQQDEPAAAHLDLAAVVLAACRLADAFGRGVTESSSEVSFAEIRSSLPPHLQAAFPGDPRELAGTLDGAIDPEHLLSHVTLVERIATLPERRISIPRSPFEPPPSQAPLEVEVDEAVAPQPPAWELPVLVCLGLMVLLGLAAVCYLSKG